ncbi:hypothetical protein DBR32_12245 [Taibaiella sp. KBW10]|uniref:type II CAAX endopeptidase family protein n=1 Tax=Taibaiella sp. KBW10 TaxID=2153357 RepID=UPI000F598288|nr:type II CAAX endopeptidase family protein [Taibaiella sp. KBW10]RQO30335.1 hypothetical protein DBR32_12245 [Taibaiella sp. KBW10]
MRLFQLRRQSVAIQLLIFLCLYFLCSLLLLVVLSGLAQVLHIDFAQISAKKTALNTQETIGILSITTLNQVLTFLLPALLFIYLIPERPKAFLSFKPVQGQSILWVILLSLGLLSLILGSTPLIQSLPFGKAADSLQEQRKQLESSMLQMKTIGDLLVRIGVIALVPAICEEVFFRGIVQRFTNSFIKNPVWSIVAVSIFFASFHGSVYNFLPVAIAGFVLGLVYHYTGNIWYNIILHFFNNAIQVVQVYLISKHPEMDIEAFPIAIAVSMMLIGGVIVYIAFKQTVKGKTPSPKLWGMSYINNHPNPNLS